MIIENISVQYESSLKICYLVINSNVDYKDVKKIKYFSTIDSNKVDNKKTIFVETENRDYIFSYKVNGKHDVPSDILKYVEYFVEFEKKIDIDVLITLAVMTNTNYITFTEKEEYFFKKSIKNGLHISKL